MTIDEALRTASSSLDDIVSSVPDREAPDPPTPTRTKGAVAALVAVTVVGGAVTVDRARPDSVTVAADTSVDEPERLASSNVPGDLELRFAGSTALLGEPGRVETTQVYAEVGSPGRRLTIGHAPAGAFRIPIAGEPIQLSVGTARSAPGESLIVVDTDDGQLLVDSPHLIEPEMLAIIDGLRLDGDGSPRVLARPPDGLTFLGSTRRAWFEQLPVTVDPEAEVTSYVASPERHLTVSVVPDGSSNWTTTVNLDDFVVEEVGGRSGHVARHDQFVQVIWTDGRSLVRVAAVGLTAMELDRVIEGLAVSDEIVNGPSGTAGATDPGSRNVPVAAPVLADAGRPLSNGLPAGFELAADPSDLGEGVPAGSDVLLYDGTSSRTVRIEIREEGDAHAVPDAAKTEIDGVEVGHTTDPTNNVAVFPHRSRSVRITAGLSTQSLLDLVEDVLATDLSVAQLGDAAATPVFTSTQLARWATTDGSTITGPADTWNAVYLDEAGATVRISSRATDLGYPPSVLHGGSASIDLGSVDGVLSPHGDGWVIEFVSDGHLLSVTGSGVSTQQLLDVISGLYTAG